MVLDCGSCKSLISNGFSFGFIKRYLDLVFDDVVEFVSHFYSHSSISKGCNASFFTVILKVKHLNTIIDFILISLIGCQ